MKQVLIAGGDPGIIMAEACKRVDMAIDKSKRKAK